MAILSDVRLQKPYPSQILRAASLAPDSSTLIRMYVQCVKPPLVQPLDMECYCLALADSSLLAAWDYVKSFKEDDPMRARLWKSVLGWSVLRESLLQQFVFCVLHVPSAKPRPTALTHLLALPLSKFEESTLHSYVQRPPSELPFTSVAVLQDLVCVRLIQGSRFAEAIKLDKALLEATPPKYAKDVQGRAQMVRGVYDALPAVEKALLELELGTSSTSTTAGAAAAAAAYASPMPTPKPTPKPDPQRRSNGPEGKNGDTNLSQSWVDIQLPEAPGAINATPLREVSSKQVKQSGTPFGTTPRAGGLNFNGSLNASTSTPLKNLPLSSSVLGASASRTRTSPGTFGFGNSTAVASPVSGMKIPHPLSSSVVGHGLSSRVGPTPSKTPTPAGNGFSSASMQPNAFYQPPQTKTNGTKRPHESDTSRDVDMGLALGMEDAPIRQGNGAESEHERVTDGEKRTERASKRGRKSGPGTTVTPASANGRASLGAGSDGENAPLDYSIFGPKSKQRGTKLPSRAESQAQVPSSPETEAPPIESKRGSKRAPPGSLASGGEEEESDDEPSAKRTTRTRARASRASVATPQVTRTLKARASTSTPSKPPAKRTKRTKEKGPLRSIPGAFDDGEVEHDSGTDHDPDHGDEDVDHVAPLTQTSPVTPAKTARATRKSRASASVDTVVDEMELGIQTRRTSSRLKATTSGSIGDLASPERESGSKGKGKAVAKTTRGRKKRV